jgi:hypothetical protein
MNNDLLTKIDAIYEKYGYDVKKNHSGVRVYIFTKSIYNGADILDLGEHTQVESVKKYYSNQGYAVKIKNYQSYEEAEQELFKDFFKADGVLSILKRRYHNFVERLMQHLPSHSIYEYIDCPYEYTLYNPDKTINYQDFTSIDKNTSIVNKVVDLLQHHIGPLFIIIEAAAGYGKTCTAYEILNEFLKINVNKLPFFTELSRDRKATIFKHILLNEIEEQFSRSITSDVVVHEIKSGRIPLIIDGFDELISKDFSFAASEFQQVESMLSTIVDLLSENAKIVITSRKTAIFNSEEFLQWMEAKEMAYSLLRISISEPKIENWLNAERLQILDEGDVPVQNFANPVLLTYLRYTQLDNLKEIVLNKKTIVDDYIHFLLDREQVRQNLPIDPDVQLRIFKKLVRLFTEFDIKSTHKDDLKDFILDYNKKILEDALKKYASDKRPTLDQLANTLTNHAFLDRKDNKNIGFVNEFVLGTLIGENLICGDYQRHRLNFHQEISQSFSLLGLQAYKVQPKDKKEKLWNIYNTYPFSYEQQFFFKIDVDLANKVERTFKEAAFHDFELEEIIFLNPSQFTDSTFTNCIFRSCIFNPDAFSKVSFVSCKFYDCSYEDEESNQSTDRMSFFGCQTNNNFDISNEHLEESKLELVNNLEQTLLELHFKVGTLKARYRTLSQIRSDLKDYNLKDIDGAIKQLEKQGYILLNGNNSFLSQDGVTYYNNNYRKAL